MTLLLRAWKRTSLVFFVLMHLACLLVIVLPPTPMIAAGAWED